MKRTLRSFDREPIITLMADVTYAQVPFWFNGTQKPLKMDVLLPKHREAYEKQPTIVWVCGGAFQQVDRHIWMAEMVWFAKHGYTVASVEYRTSMEAAWPAQVVDVKQAIRYLRAHAAQLCVDPDRIAVMGESAGGYLANFIGVTGGTSEFDKGEYQDQSSAVQAVVDFYGISTLSGTSVASVSEGKTVIVNGDAISLLMGCSESENPELYRKASPLNRVDSKCPPFLILHGDSDPLVDPGQSEALYEELNHAGVPVEFDVYEGVSHGADEFYQEKTKQRILEFLSRHMG